MAINVEPQSSIKLVKCKLEADYKNTFTFSSLSNQTTYFNGLTTKTIGNNNYAYVRKDNALDVDEPIDTLLQYNYLYYTNTGFSNKRFYCFIDRLEYVNENCTKIYFHTDVFQTWYFQIEWNRCFVEREHVNSDTIGEHTVPENLELGGYVCDSFVDLFPDGNNTVIAIAVTWLSPAITYNANNIYYNGVYSGTPIVIFHGDDALAASNFLRAYAKLGKSDAIVAIYLVPQSLINMDDPLFQWQTNIAITDDDGTSTGISTTLAAVPKMTTAKQLDQITGITHPATLNGYTPKNNKMHTHPYSYFFITNNVGGTAEFKYEDFINNTAIFDIEGAITPGCSIKCYPQNYKKLADQTTGTPTSRSWSYGITAPKYPICSWTTDVYTNWLTSQGVNIPFKLMSSAASIIGGTALTVSTSGVGGLLGGVGMIGGGISGIASVINQQYQHSLVPPQAEGNVNSGDVTYSNGDMRIPLYKMTIRAEYARIIDEYFSAYGYKVARIKVPNIIGRSQWNFIKTIGCNADGDIPQEDLEVIRKACDNGITFWHNPANIYNYSLTNSIV